MKVLLDDVFFDFGKGGISRYWESVIKEWSSNTILSQSGIEMTFLNRSGALESYGFPMIGFSHRNFEFDYRALERQLLASICQSENIDVFVSTYNTWVPGVKNLCVVHDLIPDVFGFEHAARDWIDRRLSITMSDYFVTVSESTRKDLQSYYDFIDDSVVSIARPGVDHSTFKRSSQKDISAFRRKAGLDRNYLLIPGNRHGHYSPYKNVRVVLEAIARHGSADLDVVFTGGEVVDTWEVDAISSAGASLKRFDFIDADLALAYSGASVVVYPSLYEGFGMPPLEALAVGTPVITTLNSSLPESVGGLSLDFDGLSTESFMQRLTESISDGHVRRIRKTGPEWAAGFTWKETAEAMAQALVRCFEVPDFPGRDAFVAKIRDFNEHLIRLQR